MRWLCAAVAVGAALAAGGEVPRDPIHVYYAGRHCESSALQVETWDRKEKRWRAHPAHPFVPAHSCQLEDAGRLLNELRWRCAPSEAEPKPAWYPLPVFDPEVVSRCAVEQVDPEARRTRIAVDSPRDGEVIRADSEQVKLEGRVLVDGVDGGAYDAVLLVDRSAPDGGLVAQARAGRAFVRRLRPRLAEGDVRVALLSYPGPDDSSHRRELGFSRDAGKLEAALGRVARRPAQARAGATASALEAALDLLENARPAARRLLVLAADGGRLDAEQPTGNADGERPLLEPVARAAESGAELHWFALGGLALETQPLAVQHTLASGRGSFRRVLPAEYGEAYLAGLSLPVAEALWVVNETAERRGAGAVEKSGRFAARAPVQPGLNRLVIHAQLSDESVVEQPFELVFDEALQLQEVLEGERARIRAARHKRLELRPDD